MDLESKYVSGWDYYQNPVDIGYMFTYFTVDPKSITDPDTQVVQFNQLDKVSTEDGTVDCNNLTGEQQLHCKSRKIIYQMQESYSLGCCGDAWVWFNITLDDLSLKDTWIKFEFQISGDWFTLTRQEFQLSIKEGGEADCPSYDE